MGGTMPWRQVPHSKRSWTARSRIRQPNASPVSQLKRVALSPSSPFPNQHCCRPHEWSMGILCCVAERDEKNSSAQQEYLTVHRALDVAPILTSARLRSKLVKPKEQWSDGAHHSRVVHVPNTAAPARTQCGAAGAIWYGKSP